MKKMDENLHGSRKNLIFAPQKVHPLSLRINLGWKVKTS